MRSIKGRTAVVRDASTMHTPDDVVLALRRDHRTVLERFDELRSAISRARVRAPSRLGALRRAARVIDRLQARLPAHFRLEERWLPPPAPHAVDEHRELAATLVDLRAAVDRALVGNGDPLATLDRVERFTSKLERHIAGEEAFFRRR